MKAYLSIPYIGKDVTAEGVEFTTRNWAHLTFVAEKLDKRKIKRIVRKYIKQSLQRTLHSEELRLLMKRVRYE